jgi:hypothetical protein
MNVYLLNIQYWLKSGLADLALFFGVSLREGTLYFHQYLSLLGRMRDIAPTP